MNVMIIALVAFLAASECDTVRGEAWKARKLENGDGCT